MKGHQGEFSMQVLSRQRGVSLIEVLVAMLIFSIGVLGIALMQIKGAQYTKQAGARTVAVLQARSLADAMRANPAGVYGVDNKDLIPSKNGDLSDSYYVYSGPAVPTSVGCTNDACRQAHSDLAPWITQLKAAAPPPVKADGSQDGSALAAVTVDSDKGSLIITSSWNGMSASASGVAQNDSYRFAYHP
jgi:type IV pilus assembly protein PilV